MTTLAILLFVFASVAAVQGWINDRAQAALVEVFVPYSMALGLIMMGFTVLAFGALFP